MLKERERERTEKDCFRQRESRKKKQTLMKEKACNGKTRFDSRERGIPYMRGTKRTLIKPL